VKMPSNKPFRTNRLYVKLMPVDELAEFMRERQDWNLARTCHAAQRLELLTKTFDGSKGGELSIKDIAVEGTDGVVYSGVAEAYHNWRGPDRPALVFRFVLGKSQMDSTPLDDRMRQLGYRADQVQRIWGDD